MNKLELYSALKTQNVILLTPNHRLAKIFIEDYGSYLNELVWTNPAIMPFKQWLNHCYEECLFKSATKLPFLLTESQDFALWLKVTETSSVCNTLMSPSEVASLARKAKTLITEWQLPLDDLKQKHYETQDMLMYQHLQQTFITLCQNNDWLAPDQLLLLIITSFKQKLIAIPKSLVFACFNEFTPLQQHLINVLANLGCNIKYFEHQVPKRQSYRKVFVTREQEYIQVLSWAYQQVKEGKKNIACVWPDLKTVKPLILRYCNEVFYEKEAHHLYNISAGYALDTYPIVRFAITIFKLSDMIHGSVLSECLLSPYWSGGDSEYINRSLLEIALLHKNITSTSLPQLLHRLKTQSHLPQCPKLMHNLLVILEFFQKNDQTFYPSQWRIHFIELLRAIGWPGEKSLNSQEFQTIHRFNQLLSDFASLDSITGSITQKEAIYYFQLLAQSIEFQIQTPKAPIQILGILEASGQSFDALWVSGLDHETWPPQPNPNPFIPFSLQAQMGLPHATSRREYEFCKKTTEKFINANQETFFSYAEYNEDKTLLPSSLIASLPMLSQDFTNITIRSMHIFNHRSIEYIEDTKGPELTQEESLRGGSSIFKHQALCPFKSYATHRLLAMDIPMPTIGIKPTIKGALVHKSLELIWQTIKTQSNLLSLTELELQNLIKQNVHLAIELTLDEFYDSNIIQYEKKRLCNLLGLWLNYEKTREPFECVSLEKRFSIIFNDIPLNIRVDRIDKVDDHYVMIDYKTNDISPNAWLDERLTEPQLPLYALCLGDIQSIAYAILHPSSIKFKGIKKEDVDFGAITSSSKIEPNLTWIELLQRWKDKLHILANEFKQGHATINPYKGHQTCLKCHLQPLCRIYDT